MISLLVVAGVVLIVVLVVVVLFCRWLVDRTDDPGSMRDFAVVLHALPRPQLTINLGRKDKGS